MPPDARDMARLWDMLDAARTAISYTADLDYNGFVQDRKTRDATERNLEIIGEAAGAVSDELRQTHPDIPWKSIIGLRNVLAHDYGAIRYEILWSIIRDKLNELVRCLEEMGVDNPPSSPE